MNKFNNILYSDPWTYMNISIIEDSCTKFKFENNIKILYVLEGSMKIGVREEELSLTQNKFIIINENENLSISNKNNVFAILFEIYPETISMFSKRQSLQFVSKIINAKVEKNSEMHGVMMKLIQLYISKDEIDSLFVYNNILKLLSLLVDGYGISLSDHENNNYKNIQTKRLDEIITYIHRYYMTPLSLQEIADKNYVSVPYISKIFKNQIGCTFTEYVSEIRLNHVINDLVITELSITKIALDNGFPNLGAFNRVFKAKFDDTPANWRKNQKKDSQLKNEKVLSELEDKNIREKISYILENEKEVIPNIASKYKNISVSINEGKPLFKSWKQSINIGYARDVLDSDYKDQLIVMQEELGFTYARFWGIFSDDMIDEYESSSGKKYNFKNIDKLLNFLLKNNLKPIIELGLKSKIISKSTSEKLILRQFSNVNRSLSDWKELMNAFLEHCISSYGRGEVEKWYFEVYRHDIDIAISSNKTNAEFSKNLKINLDENTKTYEDYFLFFEAFYVPIKNLLPNSKVGGCGLNLEFQNGTIETILKVWHKRKIKPDYFSIYIYPVDFNVTNEEIPVFNFHSRDLNYVSNRLKNMHESLEKNGFHNAELNVTEWNSSISNRDYLNDSCFKAAYIAKSIIHSLEQVNFFSYWLYSDLFGEFNDWEGIFYGGAGLITKNGIKKPGFYVFKLLNNLGSEIIDKGDNYIITKNEKNGVEVFYTNYKHFNEDYYKYSESITDIKEIYTVFKDDNSEKIKIKINGISNGKYRIKINSLNRENGSALDKWVEMGAANDLSEVEIKYLKQMCQPKLYIKHIEVKDNIIELEYNIEAHGVSLIEINPISS